MQPTRSGVSLLLAMSGQSEPSFGMSEKRRFADVTACTANDDAKGYMDDSEPGSGFEDGG